MRLFRSFQFHWRAGLILAALLLASVGPGAEAQAQSQEQGFSGLARIDPDASFVTDSRTGVEIGLSLSQGVPWRVFTLADPPRLVLDFREVDWTGLDTSTLDRSERISGIRVGGFRPGWSRLVADLAQPLAIDQAGLRVDPETGAARLGLRLSRTSRGEFEAGAGAPHDPRWDLPPAADLPRPPGRPEPGAPLTVVLDPGHGGIDPGAEEGGVTESRLMLTMALEIREALLRTGEFRVVLTREADNFVSLERRVAIAHQAGADVFISLHADSLAQGVARGTTIYTLAETASDAASAALAERHDRDDMLAGVDLTGSEDELAGVLMDLARLETAPRSDALARALADGIGNATGHLNSHARRHAGFSVLKAADVPSVLIEAGFLSTPRDRKRLTDPLWRAGFVAGLRDGLQAWALEDAAEAELRRR